MVAPIIGSGLALLLLAHCIINALVLRRPSSSRLIEESVAILVPCRNEETNVVALLHSLQAQSDLEDFRIILLDDNSSDQTLQRAQAAADDRTTIVKGAALEPDWLGKPFACYQLAQEVPSADVLVFIDADVRLEPTAIAQAVATLRDSSLSLISPYPHQIARTWSERLIQPLLQWSWLTTLPLKAAETSLRTSLTAANGQFIVVDGDSYRNIGGHKAIATSVLDDIDLLKAFKRSGRRGVVIDGSEISQCRMYTSWSEVEMGYTKWLWAAFGSIPVTVAASAFLTLAYLIPLFSFGAIGAVGYLAGVLSRLVAGIRTKGRPMDALFHPVSIALLIYLMARSWWRKYRGTAMWKERAV